MSSLCVACTFLRVLLAQAWWFLAVAAVATWCRLAPAEKSFEGQAVAPVGEDIDEWVGPEWDDPRGLYP